MQTGYSEKENWLIEPESFWLNWNPGELWTYRHLLLRLVRRDFLVHHQQTLLGPLWIIFQPLIMLAMYVLIFEHAVGLSTDGIPPTLFYLSGIIVWNLFAECFSGTAFTFIQNGALFGKVYFPRLIIPLSVVLVNIIRFAIQFAVFLALLAVFGLSDFHSWLTAIVVLSVSVVFTAAIGLGLGLVFSIITAKYRDLVNVIHLIVRLMMFATPIIYPMSMIKGEARFLIYLNPLSALVELFRYGFLGEGTFEPSHLAYSVLVSLILISIGIMLFNKFGNRLQDVI